MPIAVRVVSEQEFNAWVEDAKKKYAQGPASRATETAGLESTGANE
jgi:cytochrome c oxidase subunit 2